MKYQKGQLQEHLEKLNNEATKLIPVDTSIFVKTKEERQRLKELKKSIKK